MISASVIKDSVCDGDRITTFLIESPKFINAEINTHRVFSRNFASSRAIPTLRMLERMRNNPVIPVEWGLNKRGMYATKTIENEEKAKFDWLYAMEDSIKNVRALIKHNIHKQIVNRIVEPWIFQTGIITSTEWSNFFTLRCNKDAQPEMRMLANKMKDAYYESIPLTMDVGMWHIPLVDETDSEIKSWTHIDSNEARKMVSVARCARLSYGFNKRSGKSNFDDDLNLYYKLKKSGHFSPFEHQAKAMPDYSKYLDLFVNIEDKEFVNKITKQINFHANFRGWKQYRGYLEL